MPRLFRMIFYDDDQRTYNTSMPIKDDTEINKRTCELQNSGRHVRVSSADVDDCSQQDIEREMERLGYRRDAGLTW